jgi:hypothetical protein
MLRLIRFEVIMGGYILLKIDAGFNDALSILWNHVEYAKTHGRTIILCLRVYGATKIEELIDFSEFPVPILCGESHVKNITFSSIEPSCFDLNPYRNSDKLILSECGFYVSNIDGHPTRFDMTKEYSDDILLIFMGFGNTGVSIETMKHIKFTPKLLSKFHKQHNVFLKPVIPTLVHKRMKIVPFLSVHVRATDYPGYDEDADIAKVDEFIAVNPGMPVYLASDNYQLVEKLRSKNSRIVVPMSYRQLDKKYYALHYSFGKSDPECLSDAIVDILMCASGYVFLPSRGGFSTLINNIRNTAGLLKKLISEEGEPPEMQTSVPPANETCVITGKVFWLCWRNHGIEKTTSTVAEPGELQTSDSCAKV